MKKLKQTVMLIGVTALMMAVNSCKKEPDVNDIAQTSINDENDAEGRCHHHHQCLAIHTEDDGLGYVQDIYYNGHQNPDSTIMAM